MLLLRSRPRRRAAGLVAALGVLLAAPAAAVAASPRVSVTPGAGGPTTTFTVHVRVPAATGTFGSLVRRDLVSVTGPHGSGCLARASRTMRPAHRGAREALALDPRRLAHRHWCTGTYHGTVLQTQVIRCAPPRAQACPQLLIAPRTIGRFGFRVRPAQPPPSGSGTRPSGPTSGGPTFAGLTSATFCGVPRPLIQPRETMFLLSWTAATDPMTSSSQIVYEVFMSATPGGEDYAHPTATTPPGATTTTVAVPAPGAPAYFVVRARDVAGVTDGNTVEREAVNSCTGIN